MTDPRRGGWPAILGVLGATAIAIGFPYPVLAYGGDLPERTQGLVIVMVLVVGGALVRGGQSPAVDDDADVTRDTERRDP